MTLWLTLTFIVEPPREFGEIEIREQQTLPLRVHARTQGEARDKARVNWQEYCQHKAYKILVVPWSAVREFGWMDPPEPQWINRQFSLEPATISVVE